MQITRDIFRKMYVVFREVDDAILAGKYNLNPSMPKASNLDQNACNDEDEDEVEQESMVDGGMERCEEDSAHDQHVETVNMCDQVDEPHISFAAKETLLRKLYIYCTKTPIKTAEIDDSKEYDSLL